jgi:hypothetical protein
VAARRAERQQKRTSTNLDSSQRRTSSPMLHFASLRKSIAGQTSQHGTPTPNGLSTYTPTATPAPVRNTASLRSGIIVEPSPANESHLVNSGLSKKQRRDKDQPQLNFARSKGKGAVLNPDWIGEADTFRNPGTNPSTAASTPAAPKTGVDKLADARRLHQRHHE